MPGAALLGPIANKQANAPVQMSADVTQVHLSPAWLADSLEARPHCPWDTRLKAGLQNCLGYTRQA